MGYRSKVVIAISKEELVRNLITGTPLPQMLRDPDWATDVRDGTSARYWVFDGIKWYDSLAVVKEVELYLWELGQRDDDADKPLYGVIRVGEDDEDIERQGDPGHFGIFVERIITLPDAIAVTPDPEPAGASQ